MVCRNICERIYSKIVVGESHYFVGKNTAEDANVTYYITKSSHFSWLLQLVSP
jgi:hypothetical protein